MLQSWIQYLPVPLRKRLAGRKTLVAAAENSGWILLNRVLRLAVGLLVSVWVARYLGPEQYGLFSYALSVVQVAAALVPLGLNQITVRDAAMAREDRNVILGSSFALQAAAALVMLLISVGVALVAHADAPVVRHLILILSALTLLKPSDTITYWFQSQHRSVNTLIANSLSLLFMALVRVGMLLYQAPLLAFAVVLVLEQAINFAVLLYLYQRSGESVRHWRFDFRRAKLAAAEGLPFLLAGVAASVFTRGNQIMVKTISGAAATGYYAAATRVADLWYMVPESITASALPVIAKAKAEGERDYERRLVFLMRAYTGISLAGALLAGVIAPWAIRLVYGPAYSGAAVIFSIHIWRAVPIAMSSGTGAYLVSEGRTMIVLQKTVAQALLTLLANFWLIPRYEGQGAALSLLASAVVVAILWDFVDPRLRRLREIKLHAWMPWWFPLRPGPAVASAAPADPHRED